MNRNGNLISVLRNMMDDIESLGASPITVDVNVLRQAIAAIPTGVPMVSEEAAHEAIRLALTPKGMDMMAALTEARDFVEDSLRWRGGDRHLLDKLNRLLGVSP